jgi:uncharacterized RDD family membrane protein YckC
VYCIVCGAKNPEYAAFCYQCGAKLVRPLEMEAASSVLGETDSAATPTPNIDSMEQPLKSTGVANSVPDHDFLSLQDHLLEDAPPLPSPTLTSAPILTEDTSLVAEAGLNPVPAPQAPLLPTMPEPSNVPLTPTLEASDSNPYNQVQPPLTAGGVAEPNTSMPTLAPTSPAYNPYAGQVPVASQAQPESFTNPNPSFIPPMPVGQPPLANGGVPGYNLPPTTNPSTYGYNPYGNNMPPSPPNNVMPPGYTQPTPPMPGGTPGYPQMLPPNNGMPPGYNPNYGAPPTPPMPAGTPGYGYNTYLMSPPPSSRATLAPNGQPYVVVDNPNSYYSYKTKEGKQVYAAYAEMWPRIGAAIIDTIVVFIPFFCIFGIYLISLGPDKLLELSNAISAQDAAIVEKYEPHWTSLPFMLFYLLYATLLTTTKGQTLGKRFFRLTVLTSSGTLPDLTTSLLRNSFGFAFSLAQYIVFYDNPITQLLSEFLVVVVGLGFSFAFFDKRRQGWHDKLAGTLVVKKKQLVEGVDFPAKGSV